MELMTKYLMIPTINAVKPDILKLNSAIVTSDIPTFEFKSVDLTQLEPYIQNPNRNAVRMLLKTLAYEHQDDLLPTKWEIEHIFPQKWQTNYFPDEPDATIKERIEHIGNKLPFEKKINIVAGNGYFGKKKKEYTASKIVITKAMGTSDVMDWNLESITKRDIRVSDEVIEIMKRWNNEYLDVPASEGKAEEPSEEEATIRNFRIVQTEGSRQVTRNTKHYNLQMIIAVGFKVNSERAVQFRKWVNQIAKDYTIKGWVMDDERLKRGTYLTEKYFDEQLERIREIRASERKFYQKITDLYATAIDYDKNSATTRRFYATVQNKMHYAVHGHTAAELIVERADHIKEHMGLTTWADAPEGKIKKSDVTVAKNYLSQDEMKPLNRMVTAYLDFAENMTLRHIPLTMQDWEKRLNSFIEMFDYGILQDAGKVSAEIAKLHAETEFEKYRVIQDRLFMSDFDKFMLELEENAKK